MENKINIAELLKDCPKGMELDCTMYDNLHFNQVYDDSDCLYKISCYTTVDEIRTTVNFTEFGTFNTHANSKCVIFPKGKTTWEGFIPPCKFKDGDVVAITMIPEGIWTGIFKEYEETYFESHCYLNTIGEFRSKGFKNHSLIGLRFATQEEKTKLFDAIKANGYKWNAETKTLEKLPKFKVGDRVKHISAYTSGIVVKVDDKGYHIDYPKGEGVCYINFTLEKDYELAPNKFDINTLKPFESRVLVRGGDKYLWKPAIFGFYNEAIFYTLSGNSWSQCIPYERNEHLLGTTKDCDEYYKNWE